VRCIIYILTLVFLIACSKAFNDGSEGVKAQNKSKLKFKVKLLTKEDEKIKFDGSLNVKNKGYFKINHLITINDDTDSMVISVQNVDKRL